MLTGVRSVGGLRMLPKLRQFVSVLRPGAAMSLARREDEARISSDQSVHVRLSTWRGSLSTSLCKSVFP